METFLSSTAKMEICRPDKTINLHPACHKASTSGHSSQQHVLKP